MFKCHPLSDVDLNVRQKGVCGEKTANKIAAKTKIAITFFQKFFTRRQQAKEIATYKLWNRKNYDVKAN